MRTLFAKLWDEHVVYAEEGAPALLYIDLHLVHEVTSPQAFDGLRAAGRRVRRPDLTVATVDHNVPTTDRRLPVEDPVAAAQMEALRRNCREFGVTLYDVGSDEQGIVHVIGPELGLTRPGQTIVCGDSHTSTHGAFGALAFGIGTSEVELDASQLEPHVTWGTSPGQVVPVTGRVPDPLRCADDAGRRAAERALDYMALAPGTRIEEVAIDRVFIGSCTNARIADLRAAAPLVRGHPVP